MVDFKTILVPVDFSDHSAEALDHAIGVAQKFGAKLHLLHCYPINPGGIAPYGIVLPDGFEREIRLAATQHLEEWSEKAKGEGLEVSISLTPLFPSRAIAEEANEIGADLVVMSTHGHTGIKHALLGSVAERTLRVAPCPVLTVKARESH